MSKSEGALNYCNVLDIINDDRSRDYPEYYTEYIVNADKDILLSLINGGQ
jgi:hypothetical protein